MGRAPDLTTIYSDLALLEAAVATMPALNSMLEAKRAERASKLAEAEGGLVWTDVVQRLAERDEVDEWSRDLWRPRDSVVPLTILTPDALRLRHEPTADCARYDSLRRAM